jgi:ATP-dependent DNA helicase PIF1
MIERMADLYDDDSDLSEDSSDIDIALGQDEEDAQAKEPYCEFLTGSSGSGKTFEIKRRVTEDPHYAVLGSTTGISAINLGTRTIHSILGYFNTASLQENFRRGYVQSKLRKLAMEEGFRNLCIDEISMMPAAQLDTIYEAVKEVNNFKTMKDEGCSLGIILTGDFCQLPGISDEESGKCDFAFEAECWPRFQANTTRLTKIWRQENIEFINVLNLLRAGKGAEATELVKTMTRFRLDTDPDFEGTTILSTNREVERANVLRLMQLKGKSIIVPSKRWGVRKIREKPPSEWKIIPEQLQVKIGALVMILANARSGGSGSFEYVNGDLGHIVDFTDSPTRQSFQIELLRNKKIVNISRIHRTVTSKDQPEEVTNGELNPKDIPLCEPPIDPAPFGRVSLEIDRGVYHVGGIEYFPLRVGYAATTHKVQGLSLDQVQIDFRGHFFGHPGSLYVAVSRCKTPEGLRLVGSAETFAKRCVIDERVIPWL